MCAIHPRVSNSPSFYLQIDRNNAGAARLKGFEAGLHLKGSPSAPSRVICVSNLSTGQEFATLLSILYVGYIIMQIPSYAPSLHCSPFNTHMKQEYVLELVWKAVTLSAIHDDYLGNDFRVDRFAQLPVDTAKS